MIKRINGLSIDLISHPGETLKEVLEHENMTQQELSIRINLDKKTISQIINGVAPITQETALKLENVFNLKSSFWNTLQSRYNENLVRIKEVESITEQEIAILEDIPYKDLMKIGYIENTKDKNNLILLLRRFFRINDLSNITQLYKVCPYYRKSEVRENPLAMATWLRICEIETSQDVQNIFNKKLLLSKIQEIKQLNLIDINVAIEKLKELFKECGISFNVVHNITGAPVQGTIFNLNNKMRLCVTIRQKYADVFWFTLFHEIGHLLNLKNNEMFIDFDEKTISDENLLEIEKSADNFASRSLIDQKSYASLIKKENIYKSTVIEFARENGVIPGIVVGRLHHDKRIKFSFFNDLRLKYEWTKKASN